MALAVTPLSFPPEPVIFKYLTAHPETSPDKNCRKERVNEAMARVFARSSHSPATMVEVITGKLKGLKLFPPGADNKLVKETIRGIGSALRDCATGKPLKG